MERVNGYMQMFDRILLYTLAKNTIPQEIIDETIDLWNLAVRKGIDMDASNRTQFLESTQAGRVAKLQKEPDGESVRLHNTHQLKIAQEIISSNLKNGDEDTGFNAKLD